MKKISILAFLAILLFSCQTKQEVEIIISNAKIYTVDQDFSMAEAMAIKDGKVVAIGDQETILSAYHAHENIDLGNRTVYPGFIDAHSHFVGYGVGLVSRADLVGTKDFDEVLERLVEYEKQFSSEWINARGWDQNDWEIKEYPTKEKLDELWPTKPVYLTRIDGHAAIVNSAALKIAGIDGTTKIDGGEIILENGEPTGVLIDNAMDVVRAHIPGIGEDLKRKAILMAEKNCFEKGLTSVCDAGLDYNTIQLLDKMQQDQEVKMRVYAMLSATEDNIVKLLPKGPYKTDRLNVRSVKLYADGALGSRGACLIHDYHDKPNWKGMMLSPQAYYDSLCLLAYENNFQVNTHAIGDSANRVMLQTYAKYLKGDNDKRWRIEHAQVVHPSDFHMFKDYDIVPSVQPTHATSDMYWADERLGLERLKSAYAYETLRKQNNWIPLGTDFPIEKIDPLLTFYAAVIRKDTEDYPNDGFQMENALSRENALRGMTIWAAKAAFEEQEKGSLEKGKFADFIVLDQDILKVDEKDILNTKVHMTYVNGELVYKR